MPHLLSADAVQIAHDLQATVQSAAEQLCTLDQSIILHRPSPDRWTIKEVIGHLIDSAANNHQRFIRAQFTTELIFPKYQQNEWVNAQFYNEVPWGELIDLWRLYNLHLVHVMKHAKPAALNVQCTIGDNPPVSLHFLMEDYVIHLKHHLSKIAERVHPATPKSGQQYSNPAE